MRSSVRTRAWAISLIFGASTAIVGCPFYDLPRDDSVDRLLDPHVWLPSELGTLAEFAESIGSSGKAIFDDELILYPEGEKEGNPPLTCPDDLPRQLVFLHISDAQIRDERAYDDVKSRNALDLWDLPIGVSVRRPIVERFDAFTLAAFLIAYPSHFRKTYRALGSGLPLIIHTGDLLDISLSTELLEAMSVLRLVRVMGHERIFSLAGNHDGLTFGNIQDAQSDTRGMGVNKSEFVLGHLLADMEGEPGHMRLRSGGSAVGAGFGFAGNEIIVRALTAEDAHGNDRRWPFEQPGEEELPGCDSHCQRAINELFHDIRKVGSAPQRGNDLRPYFDEKARHMLFPPIVFRRLIDVSADADATDLRLGYYAWTEEPFVGPAIRFVALDTRDRSSSEGHLDDVQLGWLYNELVMSRSLNQPVVVLAHHSPKDIKRFYVLPGHNRRTLTALLHDFPNVVAYFYGHGHVNRQPGTGSTDRPAFIQTGSLADFPQVGREVALCFADDPGKMRIAWRFVRPGGKRKRARGLLADAVLKASLKDSEKEYRSEHPVALRRVAHYLLPAAFNAFEPFEQGSFRKEELSEGWVDLKFAFETETCPSAEQVFGTRGLERTNRLRIALGLPRIRESCTDGVAPAGASAPDAGAAPWSLPFQEASGLLTLDAEGLGVVVSDEVADGLFVFERPGDLAFELTSDVAWKVPYPDGLEVDDAEALAGSRGSVYVVGSQSLTRKGKSKTPRNTLAKVKLSLDGRSIEGFRSEAVRERLVQYLRRHLDPKSFDLQALAAEVPDEGGLDVEGAALLSGRLMLGLRSPTAKVEAQGLAVMVPFETDETFEPVGEPVLIDVQRGEGIRGMAPDGGGGLLILLGPSTVRDKVPFRVVRWTGWGRTTAALPLDELASIHQPEGIARARHDQLMLVSDTKSVWSPDVFHLLWMAAEDARGE